MRRLLLVVLLSVGLLVACSGDDSPEAEAIKDIRSEEPGLDSVPDDVLLEFIEFGCTEIRTRSDLELMAETISDSDMDGNNQRAVASALGIGMAHLCPDTIP